MVGGFGWLLLVWSWNGGRDGPEFKKNRSGGRVILRKTTLAVLLVFSLRKGYYNIWLCILMPCQESISNPTRCPPAAAAAQRTTTNQNETIQLSLTFSLSLSCNSVQIPIYPDKALLLPPPSSSRLMLGESIIVVDLAWILGRPAI